MAAASIPSWQLTALQNLASQGLLSGVDPAILAAIDQAESSGEVQGAGVNPEGYGGYFGLSTAKYPGGHQVTTQLLETNNPDSFAVQAETAAAEFASLLSEHGGDVYAAETAYQGGSSEGTTLFAQLGIPRTETGASVTPAPPGSSAGAQLTSVGGSVAGAVASSIPGIGPVLNLFDLATSGSWYADALELILVLVFLAGGVGLIVLGLTRVFPGVTTTVTKAAAAAA